MPEYFDRYINLNDDVDVIESLNIGLREWQDADLHAWEKIGDKVYAPGKWTVKDIIQHIIDTERIFSYRALNFARGDREARPFDEDQFALHAMATGRTLSDLIDEAIAVRTSTLKLYQSFTPDMLARIGISFKGEYSVEAIGFIFTGHQRWHFGVIKERYMPLGE